MLILIQKLANFVRFSVGGAGVKAAPLERLRPKNGGSARLTQKRCRLCRRLCTYGAGFVAEHCNKEDPFQSTQTRCRHV